MLIKKIAVVGCGTMGGGIIQLAAQYGFEVVGVEPDEDAVARAQQRIEAGLDATLARGKITTEQVQQARRLYSISTDLGTIAEADLVVEAVYEDVELKKQLLREVDRLVGPETLIASNTSTIPLSSSPLRRLALSRSSACTSSIRCPPCAWSR